MIESFIVKYMFTAQLLESIDQQKQCSTRSVKAMILPNVVIS